MTTATRLVPLRIAVIENDVWRQRTHGWAHIYWGQPMAAAAWVYDAPPGGPTILSLS